LAGEEQNFKKTEKVKKGEFKDSLVADHVLIAAKIRKENHPDFKLSDETTPSGLGNLWAQLEKAESERASALAAEQIRIGGQGKTNKQTNMFFFVRLMCFSLSLFISERLKLLHDNEEFWVKLQAIARGNEVRRQIKAMNDYYKSHEDKIIKIQALWRSKTAGEHYRALSKCPFFFFCCLFGYLLLELISPHPKQ